MSQVPCCEVLIKDCWGKGYLHVAKLMDTVDRVRDLGMLHRVNHFQAIEVLRSNVRLESVLKLLDYSMVQTTTANITPQAYLTGLLHPPFFFEDALDGLWLLALV